MAIAAYKIIALLKSLTRMNDDKFKFGLMVSLIQSFARENRHLPLSKLRDRV